MRILAFIAPLLLSSCVDEGSLNNSFPIHLLHGNSAKVWVLTKSSDPNDKNVAALNNYRKTLIFYSNHSFREQELIHLGSNEGYKGKYRIEEDGYGELTLHLNYHSNKKRHFVIQSISNNLLTLLDREGSNAIWNLTSLKPPQL